MVDDPVDENPNADPGHFVSFQQMTVEAAQWRKQNSTTASTPGVGLDFNENPEEETPY